MNPEFIVAALLGIIVFILVWFSIQVQVLVNKIMSRTYSEYEMAKPEKPQPKREASKPQESGDFVPYMTGFKPF